MAAPLVEDEIERRIIWSLTVIAVLSIAGTVYLAATAANAEFGIDTAVIVALVGVVAQCASALGTRRHRQPAVGPPPPAASPAAPPAE